MKYFLRTFTLIFVGLISFGGSSFSSDFIHRYELNVGVQPLSIVHDEFTGFHVFCGGWDANYNGVFEPDSGDVYPSWWYIENFDIPCSIAMVGDVKKLRDFEFGFIGYPFRPAVINSDGNKNGKIFFSHLGRIRCFALKDGSLLDDTVANIHAEALSIIGDNLFLSIRTYSGSDYVIVYDYKTKIYLDTIPAYSNVNQTLPFQCEGKQYLAILNEGNFGANDSKLQIIEVNDNTYIEIKTLNIGGGANHLTFNKSYKKLAVTLNGSHEIKIISAPDFNIERNIHIPTSGWDGPREATFSPNTYNLYVTAFIGKTYIYKWNTGTLVDSLDSHGKAEGIVNYNDFALLFANPFIKGGYTPDSTVTVYEKSSSVSELKSNTCIKIYPNPVEDKAIIEIENNDYLVTPDIEIINYNGMLIKRFNCESTGNGYFHLDFSAKTLGLSDGMYIARIIGKNSTNPISFIVIK